MIQQIPAAKKSKLNKKHFTLLEVLIAFALIVLCVLPIISPHVAIYKAQRSFVKKIELDHVVNLLYANIYEDIQKNKIPWEKLEDKTIFPISSELLTNLNNKKPLPYVGTYQFEKQDSKPNPPGPLSVYVFKLLFKFQHPKEKPLEYEYKIFMVRNLEGTASHDPAK